MTFFLIVLYFRTSKFCDKEWIMDALILEGDNLKDVIQELVINSFFNNTTNLHSKY